MPSHPEEGLSFDMKNVFCGAVKTLLENAHIEYAAALPFSHCRVLREDKLRRVGLGDGAAKSALILLTPYYVDDKGESPISRYARSRDYHLYFDRLFSDTCAALKVAFPQHRFYAFADNSPIDERHAACIAGLGVLGDNGLLLNEAYGSYVFIGEILSDLDWEKWYAIMPEAPVYEVQTCAHCGACNRACPMEGKGGNPYGIKDCLSALSQKKHLQSEEEAAYIRHYQAGWGCDRCQTVCPYNKNPKETPIAFFHEKRLLHPTPDEIERMSDAAFSERAFAWRGRETVLRNLRLLEK